MKKEEFRCKHCLGDGKVSSSSTDVLHKEIDCLTREKQLLEKYVSELEFSNTILKSKTPAVSSTLNSAVGFFPNSSLVNTYSQAAKKVSPSAVLVIKPTDINMGNAKLEQELKSKFRPSQLNANVTGTRLIRDGVLVNCADVKSLQNLKDGLKRQAGNAFNVYEPKKLRPKIVVYILDFDFDVMCVSETWLNSDISSGAVGIPGFSLLRNDRSTRGGGVGIYFKNSMACKQILQDFDGFLGIEHIWLSIKTHDLVNLPWNDIFYINNLDDKVALFNNLIVDLFDRHAPVRTSRITKPFAPWVTPNLKAMMKKRDQALQNGLQEYRKRQKQKPKANRDTLRSGWHRLRSVRAKLPLFPVS
ncbi:unnamed protein product [Acanthoscelides obtectus]|uniref:Uncharacterized protein n=1 Tax=Acanthoscelides obtectus TaxID=200917 RepID=A0A9P0L123_ACAOB|nr:unnamed protein product [Acanthoscelides obtectus]CAK1641965.1 hypothetical protein AOBTE_LOCUS12763 [Acanthoscelides obtectus]